ncbi:MAG TPA: hypothetical protein PKL13_04330 [bacterium]|jgi:hypothetical protein|nr:hypothetical protein [bacterium]
MKIDFPNSPYWQYINALEALDKEYQSKKQALLNTLKEAQNNCSHPSTTSFPDPSGNQDSSTECDICGKEL